MYLRDFVGKKENARRVKGVDEVGERVDVDFRSGPVMLEVLLHGEDHHAGKMLAFQLVDLGDLGFVGFRDGGQAKGGYYGGKNG
jgi:hypothetical protein